MSEQTQTLERWLDALADIGEAVGGIGEAVGDVAPVADLLDRVVEADFPFFGACYGVGTLACHQGAVVD